MKLELCVHVAQYNHMRFQSEYETDMKAAAYDLIAQMQPWAAIYPAIAQKIAELEEAYGAG